MLLKPEHISYLLSQFSYGAVHAALEFFRLSKMLRRAKSVAKLAPDKKEF